MKDRRDYPVFVSNPARGGRLERSGYRTTRRVGDSYPSAVRDLRVSAYWSAISQQGCIALSSEPHGWTLRCEDASVGESRRITGYYADEFGDATLIPIVARLPRGRGWLAGYRADGDAGNYLVLDYADRYTDRADASNAAHQLAESAAEREREYQSLWNTEQDIEEREERERQDSADADAINAIMRL